MYHSVRTASVQSTSACGFYIPTRYQIVIRHTSVTLSTASVRAPHTVRCPVQISASGAKYVIACGFIPEGSHLLAALSRAHVLPSLSALFMTVAPSDESWFGLVGSDAYWTLSPGQWHYTVRPTVSVLTGPDVSYVDHYTTAYGGPPHYTAAGASGVVELLVLAFTEALESCDLTGARLERAMSMSTVCIDVYRAILICSSQ